MGKNCFFGPCPNKRPPGHCTHTHPPLAAHVDGLPLRTAAPARPGVRRKGDNRESEAEWVLWIAETRENQSRVQTKGIFGSKDAKSL